jgi:hypothetical protein
MDSTTVSALEAIDRAVAWLQRKRETGWPPLSPAYLAAIEAVEQLPQNQPGADKSWVWAAVVRDRQHFAQVRRRR